MLTRTHFVRFVERARHLPALPAAFVYPCDADTLHLALTCAFTGTVAPVLVGPALRIRDTGARAGIDLGRLPIVDTPDAPAAAASRAVELVRGRRIRALVQGALPSDELLAPVLGVASGSRGARRLSHAYFLDLAGWPRGLVLADAQLNTNPNFAARRDIVHNTVAFTHALGIMRPAVAILAAVDRPHPAFPSTADAAALKEMGDDGLFGDAIIDGPLTADSALSSEAALANGRGGDVAGHADVLIAPGAEAASLVLRTLTGLTSGLAAGIVLGADVPIVTPLPTDTIEVRMASCVLASLVASALARSAVAEATAAAATA